MTMLNQENSPLTKQSALGFLANASLVLIPASNVGHAQSHYGMGGLDGWKSSAVRGIWIFWAFFDGDSSARTCGEIENNVSKPLSN